MSCFIAQDWTSALMIIHSQEVRSSLKIAELLVPVDYYDPMVSPAQKSGPLLTVGFPMTLPAHKSRAR